MAGKIIATWSVKLTLRESEGSDPGDEPEAPTIDKLTGVLEPAAAEEFGGEWSATAERTDI